MRHGGKPFFCQFDLFFEGQDDNPQFFDGRLNPFLLFLPMLAFVRKSSSSGLRVEKQALLIFAVLFFFFTFFQQVIRIRYIVCIIPPLVILSIFGLQNLFTFIGRDTFNKYKAKKVFNNLRLHHSSRISWLQFGISRQTISDCPALTLPQWKDQQRSIYQPFSARVSSDPIR